MSTVYRITGSGSRLTRPLLTALVREHGGTVRTCPEDDHEHCCLLVEFGEDCVHFHKTGKASFNCFTRYNINDAGPVVDALSTRYQVLSEHDEGFDQ